jgi:hypothetical protein
MSDIRIVLIPNDDNVGTDAAWADSLAVRLQSSIDLRNPAIRPAVEVKAGFARLPSLMELGPLSVVGLVLPKKARGFTQAECDRIVAFQQTRSRGDIRLVPLAREQARDIPPPPLDGVVSQKIHDRIQQDDVDRFATFLLNLINQRLAGCQRKLFISFAQVLEIGTYLHGPELKSQEIILMGGRRFNRPNSLIPSLGRRPEIVSFGGGESDPFPAKFSSAS